MGWLVPSERLPDALAHEVNHNVRYQFIKWTNDVTLGEVLVGEGLAENYATTIHGEGFLSPWVSKADPEMLPLIKEIIQALPAENQHQHRGSHHPFPRSNNEPGGGKRVIACAMDQRGVKEGFNG